MGRHEYKDRFSEASKETADKSGYVCQTCGTVLNKKDLTKAQHESLIRKMTAGASLKEPAPFGP